MGYRLKATSVHVARALYALNWFDVAPGLTAISKDLGLQLVQLGIATTFFYIGLSALQLVGGALASKIGSRKVAFIGLVVLAAMTKIPPRIRPVCQPSALSTNTHPKAPTAPPRLKAPL